MAARNGKAKLAALEKADPSPAALPDLQAKDGKSKKFELSEFVARSAQWGQRQSKRQFRALAADF